MKDGYNWLTVRVHPRDAEARGIADGDIIKLYNDRGSVLGIAKVTERIRPGVVHSYCSAAQYDPLEPGKPYSTDRGGCVNLLTSSRLTSKNAAGMAPNSLPHRNDPVGNIIHSPWEEIQKEINERSPILKLSSSYFSFPG